MKNKSKRPKTPRLSPEIINYLKSYDLDNIQSVSCVNAEDSDYRNVFVIRFHDLALERAGKISKHLDTRIVNTVGGYYYYEFTYCYLAE